MRILDLFCGGGGFSKGFEMAGFDIVLGIDNWEGCEATYRANHPSADFWLADIRYIESSQLPRVDVVIGAPPCQEFSVANRNKEPRMGMELVHAFLRIVSRMEPRYWIMENVPLVEAHLPKWISDIRILNAADYGVPQVRRRCFAGEWPLPRPTHSDIPKTALDGRAVQPWMTVRESIGDLVLRHRGRGDFRATKGAVLTGSGARSQFWTTESQVRVDGRAGYLKDGLNTDGEKSLDAPSYTIRGTGTRHGIMEKHPPQDARNPARSITGRMRNDSLLMEFMDRPSNTIDDPYLRDGRRERDALGNTRLTGVAERRLRRLTVRECARLQSFPDDFQFLGTKTANYRMIGNAVPPLLAKVIAERMEAKIEVTA